MYKLQNLQGDSLRQSLLVRYFNGGTVGTGGMGSDSDNGIDATDLDGDNGSSLGTDDDEGNGDDNISTASSSLLKGSISGDSSKKTNITKQPLPPSTKSWSPPPPISFRSEQQQQHKVTHGPGGKFDSNTLN